MNIPVVPCPPLPSPLDACLTGQLKFKPIHPWAHSSCWPSMITVLLLRLQITMLLNDYCAHQFCFRYHTKPHLENY